MASSSKVTETSKIVVLERAPACVFTAEQASFKPCNYQALVDIPADKPQFRDGATFIKACPLMYAFVHRPIGITAHLQALWYTAHCTTVTTEKGNTFPAIGFQIPDHGYFSFTTGFLRKALRLPSKARNEQWAAEPTDEQIISFLDSIGYVWENPAAKSVGSKMEKRRLCAKWQYIFTQVIQCLGSKSGSMDQASKHFQDLAFALCTNYNLNYADYIFSDMYGRVNAARREKCVPYPRFFATIIEAAFGDEYSKVANHSFSMVGKKSLEIDENPGDAPYTPFMLQLISQATPVSSSLQIPPVSIPDTYSPLKRKQPSVGHKKSIAHKPPTKKQKKDAYQKAVLADKGVLPTPPSSAATTTVSSVAASSALPSSAAKVSETVIGN